MRGAVEKWRECVSFWQSDEACLGVCKAYPLVWTFLRIHEIAIIKIKKARPRVRLMSSRHDISWSGASGA
jgi:hypothetical protein